jgi:hypothetical protein
MHTPEQKALAVLIAKREAARAQLDRYKASVHVLADAEETARKAEGAAQANLQEAAVNKIKTGTDTTVNARAVYDAAMRALQAAETEHAAGKRVVLEAAHELDQLTKEVHRQCVEVAKSIAAHDEPNLVAAARAYGEALHRHRSLISFARAASADSGLVADPVADLNSNNPLKLQIDTLIAGTDLQPVGLTESSMLDAKLSEAA